AQPLSSDESQGDTENGAQAQRGGKHGDRRHRSHVRLPIAAANLRCAPCDHNRASVWGSIELFATRYRAASTVGKVDSHDCAIAGPVDTLIEDGTEGRA